MIRKLQIGYLLIGFTAGFYFAINLDQAYYFSLHHKLFQPVQEELNKPNKTFQSIYTSITQGIKDTYNDI